MVWKELIEDIQNIQIKETCSTCGKSLRTSEEGSFTSWMFKPSSCDCPATEATPTFIEKDESIEPGFPDLGDDFQVIECLGHGGMGSVYKIRRKQDQKIFAAKVLRTKIEDPSYLKRFKKEIELASKLSHPNLISIYDSGTSKSGAPFFLMECIDGRSIADLIKSDEKLTADQIVSISIQIANALDYVHKNGILHRDIKPSNILLTKESADDSYKVILVDFGIAKILPEAERKTQNLTQTSEVFGSPHYMSPEQCMGFKLDERSDIYSLGCVMYELATGTPPFFGNNPVQLIVKHIEDSASPFPHYAKVDKLTRNFEAVVLRCLDKDSSNRFESADQLKEALEKLQEGKKVPYTAIRNFRPTLSLKQAVGIFTILAFAILFFQSLSNSVIIAGLEKVFLSVIIILFLSLYASFKLTLLGVQRTKQLFQISGEPKKWWAAINYLLLGAASITFTLPISFSFGDIFKCFLALNIAACFINYFLSRTTKSVGFSFIAKRLVLTVSALTILWISATTSEQHSSAILSIAKESAIQPEFKLKLIELAYKIDPSPSTLEDIAFAQHKLNRNEEAIRNIARAIKYGPNDTYLLDYQMSWLLEMKKFDEALKLADEIIESHSFSQGHRLKGDVYEKQKEYKKALEEYSKSIEEGVETNNYMNYSVESRIRIYLKLKKYEKAFEDFKQLTLKKNSQENYFRLAVMADYLGKEEEAQKAFKKSIDKGNYDVKYAEIVKTYNWEKYSAGYHLMLAYAYKKIGVPDQFKLHLEKAEKQGLDKSKLKFDSMPHGAIKW